MKFSVMVLDIGEITWEDGELTGNQDAVDQLMDFAEDMAGTPLGPPAGATIQENYLDDHFCTKQLMSMLWGPMIIDFEDLEDIPELDPEDLSDGSEES